MWEILVVYVGRLTEDGFRRGIERYASMPSGEWRVRLESVPASKLREPEARRREETRAALAKVPKDRTPLALDDSGEPLDSPAFGRLLADQKDRGRRLAFLVGGAHGLDRDQIGGLRRISLSPMTLPHELATLVLVEQIYRASCAYIGKPYAK